MKNVLALASLIISFASCATENTNKTWQSQLNENEKLAPQVVALLGVKELNECCTQKWCSWFVEDMCQAIYNEQELKKEDIVTALMRIGISKDWVPTKSKKVADQVWESYLKFKAKNSAK